MKAPSSLSPPAMGPSAAELGTRSRRTPLVPGMVAQKVIMASICVSPWMAPTVRGTSREYALLHYVVIFIGMFRASILGAP